MVQKSKGYLMKNDLIKFDNNVFLFKIKIMDLEQALTV